METNKIDPAPSGAMTPEGQQSDRARGRGAPPMDSSVAAKSEPAATVSLEVNVSLRVELRVLQSEQTRVGEALGEIERMTEGLRRLEAKLGELFEILSEAEREEAESDRETTTVSIRATQRWIAAFREAFEPPRPALDEALRGGDPEAADAGAERASFVDADLLFRAALEIDVSTHERIDASATAVERSAEYASRLQLRFGDLRTSLEDRLESLAAGIANVDAAASVPTRPGDARELAAAMREAIPADARRALAAQGAPPASRVLELLEE